MRHALLATAFATLLASTGLAQAAPDVVATIKPIHSLVAAVMDGVGQPRLLVKGGASPHTYTMRPSDAGALQDADVVFWTGEGMELFLTDALESLTTNATVVELAKTPALLTYPMREGGAFEAHMHEGEEHDDHDHERHGHEGHDHDDHEGHDHGGEGAFDMHFWLDPENAKLMVGEIARTLSEADPENAAAYKANADKEVAALTALEAELKTTLSPISDKPFIVFHDAFQYFEKRFGLTIAGSITVSPEVMPGAQRVAELKAKVAELGAACIFAEPQFQPNIVSAIAEGTAAKTGTLDPEAGNLTEGPGLYAELQRSLANALVDCLGA